VALTGLTSSLWQGTDRGGPPPLDLAQSVDPSRAPRQTAGPLQRPTLLGPLTPAGAAAGLAGCHADARRPV